MADKDRPDGPPRQPRHHRGRVIGCLVLAALVAAIIAAFVWMDRQAPREGDPNALAPVHGPPEPMPARPPQ